MMIVYKKLLKLNILFLLKLFVLLGDLLDGVSRERGLGLFDFYHV